MLPESVPVVVRLCMLAAGPYGRIVHRGGVWVVVQAYQVAEGEPAWDMDAVEVAGLGIAA